MRKGQTAQEPRKGLWWRASAYEVRGGRIAPAEGASIEPFDPWAGFFSTGTGRVKDRAYVELDEALRALQQLPSKRKRRRSPTDKLTSWCRKWGLLGLALHRTRQVSLAFPRPEHVEGHLRLRRIFVRDCDRWSETSDSRMMNEEEGAFLDAGGTLDPPRDWPNHTCLVYGPENLEPQSSPLAPAWLRFLPSLRKSADLVREHPLPGSLEFWALYGEPLSEFTSAAQQLLDARRGIVLGTPEERASGIAHMNRLMRGSQAFLQERPVGRHGVERVWRAPSLLAHIALMACDDAQGPMVQKECEAANCNVLFISRRREPKHLKYCSENCKERAKKTTRRAAGKASA